MNALNGFYLVRAYHEEAEPFAVLTDALHENIADICEKAAPHIVQGLAEGYDYMAERMEVESWLRHGARASGVNIRKENPVYFALTRDPEAYARFKRQPMPHNPRRADKKVIVIPASETSLSACSFTYDDSFPNRTYLLGPAAQRPFRLPRHPLHGSILNAGQVAKALRTYVEPDMPRYIEVQMWDRPPAAAVTTARVMPPVKHAKAQERKP